MEWRLWGRTRSSEWRTRSSEAAKLMRRALQIRRVRLPRRVSRNAVREHRQAHRFAHARPRGASVRPFSLAVLQHLQLILLRSCFWATDDQVFSTQAGVVRTNCIDCLDRFVSPRVQGRSLTTSTVRTSCNPPSRAGSSTAISCIWESRRRRSWGCTTSWISASTRSGPTMGMRLVAR